MTTPKEQLAETVERTGSLADRGLIAAFLRDTGTDFASNPFPRTSAATVGQVWGTRVVEFRCLDIQAAGLRCLLAAVTALPRSEPLAQVILRSGPHTLNLFHHPGGYRIVGAVLHGKPSVPLPVFEQPRPAPTRRKRANPAQLDFFAYA